MKSINVTTAALLPFLVVDSNCSTSQVTVYFLLHASGPSSPTLAACESHGEPLNILMLRSPSQPTKWGSGRGPGEVFLRVPQGIQCQSGWEPLPQRMCFKLHRALRWGENRTHPERIYIKLQRTFKLNLKQIKIICFPANQVNELVKLKSKDSVCFNPHSFKDILKIQYANRWSKPLTARSDLLTYED